MYLSGLAQGCLEPTREDALRLVPENMPCNGNVRLSSRFSGGTRAKHKNNGAKKGPSQTLMRDGTKNPKETHRKDTLVLTRGTIESKDDMDNARLRYRARAHCARLERHEKRVSGQLPEGDGVKNKIKEERKNHQLFRARPANRSAKISACAVGSQSRTRRFSASAITLNDPSSTSAATGTSPASPALRQRNGMG